MSTAREEWKKVQAVLGTTQDGIPGPNDRNALTQLQNAAINRGEWPPNREWHHGKASSFADPADIRAFKRCKAQGKADQECFKVGDNGIGKWGTDTTQHYAMVALPPEDWSHLLIPAGTMVVVEANGRSILAELQDTMPRKANIKNGAIIDLNPEACRQLGLTPPMLVDARWRWA